jgi:hypothetical protein
MLLLRLALDGDLPTSISLISGLVAVYHYIWHPVTYFSRLAFLKITLW